MMMNEPTLTALLWGWGSHVLSLKGSCQAQGKLPLQSAAWAKQQTESEATKSATKTRERKEAQVYCKK